MARKHYTTGRTFIGRLENGADLLQSITRIANEEEVKAGTVQVFGSVQSAVVTVLNQSSGMPEPKESSGGMDIVLLCGTVSQFKGRAMARLSGSFTSVDGGTLSGTVAVGCIVFACEIVLSEMQGATLSRDFDPETGLPLWKNAVL